MEPADEFRHWALEPARTNDELFTVELLLEVAWDRWAAKHNEKHYVHYEVRREQCKRRCLNPAYRPELEVARFDMAAEVWAEVRHLRNDRYHDRPVRDLAALRFFPHVTAVDLHSELSDLAPFATLHGLRSLELVDPLVEDLGPLTGLPLEKAEFTLGAPWPDATSLGTLAALKELHYSGNLLALAGIPALAAVEKAWLFAREGWTTPLREARELPVMPRLEKLWLEGVADLRGLERFAELRELKLDGPFVELAPLAALAQVRKLTLQGELWHDLRPVARMAELRTFVIERHHGVDVAPLAEAPRLREVTTPYCEVIRTELAALNVTLGFVDEAMFLREGPPAPAPPLRLISFRGQSEDYKKLPAAPPHLNGREALYGDDPVLNPAEVRWFVRELERRLAKFASPEWGELRVRNAGWADLMVWRYEDALRLREFALAAREVAAMARYPWRVHLFVEHPDDPPDVRREWAQRRKGGRVFSADREQAEWEARRERQREHEEFLAREHQMRLRQQQGAPIKPEDFAPDVPPANPERYRYSDEEPGMVPRDAGFIAEVCDDIVWIFHGEREKAAPFFGQMPEDWHALPEPPEARPRPD